jgi:hypothetical protein
MLSLLSHGPTEMVVRRCVRSAVKQQQLAFDNHQCFLKNVREILISLWSHHRSLQYWHFRLFHKREQRFTMAWSPGAGTCIQWGYFEWWIGVARSVGLHRWESWELRVMKSEICIILLRKRINEPMRGELLTCWFAELFPELTMYRRTFSRENLCVIVENTDVIYKLLHWRTINYQWKKVLLKKT